MAKAGKAATPEPLAVRVRKKVAQAKKAAKEKRKAEREANPPAPKPTPAERNQAKIQAVLKDCYDALAPVAKNVNHRIKQANQLDGKADDHRLAAALLLGEAKKVCEKKGVRFKRWFAENIVDFSYENGRKLAAVGSAPNPAAALAHLRDKNSQANKELRERAAVALPSPERAIAAITQPVEAGESAAGLEAAMVLFEKLPATEKMEWLKWAADQVGVEITVEF